MSAINSNYSDSHPKPSLDLAHPWELADSSRQWHHLPLILCPHLTSNNNHYLSSQLNSSRSPSLYPSTHWTQSNANILIFHHWPLIAASSIWLYRGARYPHLNCLFFVFIFECLNTHSLLMLPSFAIDQIFINKLLPWFIFLGNSRIETAWGMSNLDLLTEE